MFLIYIQWVIYGNITSCWLLLNTSLAMVNLKKIVHTNPNSVSSFHMKISVRMKTLNAGDMMVSSLKSPKIAAADRSYLLFFFLLA